MKLKKNKKNIISFIVISLLCLLFLGSALSVFLVFGNAISTNLFDASSQNIEQIYEGVGETLKVMTESRFNYLSQAGDYIYMANMSNGQEEIKEYILDLKTKCGFSDFYLLNESGNYITLTGESGYIELGDDLFKLIDEDEDIVVDGSLPNRENMFFYASKTKASTYNDFSYVAVAFGYDLNAISKAMQVDAFEGQSDAYLVRDNGRVGANVGISNIYIRNVLSFLSECGVNENKVDEITKQFQDGETDTLIININGKEYYFSYQMSGFNDNWLLVSLTPTEIADKSIRNIRVTSISMMITLGAVIILTIVLIMSYLLYQSNFNRRRLTRERELIFESVSTHMNEIFMLYNIKEDRVAYVSPNVERMLGINPDEIYEDEKVFNQCVVNVLNKDLLGTIKPGDSLYRELDIANRITKEEKPYSLELYRQDNKDSNFLVIILSDDSEERKIRQEIIESANAARLANEAKSTFLSNMSHDIRTPMNAVIGFTTLLDNNAENPTKVHEYSKKIIDSGNHLLGLINDILDIAKIESGKTVLSLEECNLNKVFNDISDMTSSLYKAKNQTFNLHLSVPEDENVLLDKLRFTQILQNLISNAIKYTPDGGRIDVYANKIGVDNNNGIGRYHFIVKDNGIGMSEEFQKRLFEPFSRETNSVVNKIQGTGLGLAITKNLIDLMGGSISATSSINNGTTFEVFLNLKTSEVKESDKNKEVISENFSLKGLKILAAEDNELNAEILVELLKLEGADVEVAVNGLEAFNRFKESEIGKYDLILMDVQMPIMNGYDATKAIRKSDHKQSKTIPIIAMTANAFAEDIQKGKDAGMNAYLTKPVDINNLKTTIKDCLHGGGRIKPLD